MDSKEAMKLALEALEYYDKPRDEYSAKTARAQDVKAMNALREALAEQPAQQEQESLEDLHNALQRIDTAAVGLPTFEVRHEGGLDAVTQNIVDAITALHTQQAQQEPVQRYSPDGEGGMEVDSLGAWMKFTSPPAQRTWVGLTEFDIDQIPYSCSHADSRLIAYAIEAKLKEKNT